MNSTIRFSALMAALLTSVLFLDACKPHSFDMVEANVRFRPYDVIKIRDGQWKSYFELVDDRFGASRQVFDSKNLVVYDNQAEVTQYTFTLFGHPAHPAWVARKLIETEDQVIIDQTGFYAGDKAAFEKMYRAYIVSNEKLQAKLNLEFQEKKAELREKSGL